MSRTIIDHLPLKWTNNLNRQSRIRNKGVDLAKFQNYPRCEYYNVLSHHPKEKKHMLAVFDGGSREHRLTFYMRPYFDLNGLTLRVE